MQLVGCMELNFFVFKFASFVEFGINFASKAGIEYINADANQYGRKTYETLQRNILMGKHF